MRQQSPSKQPQVTWESLNRRQQDYLTSIYQADQDVEADEKSAWSSGGRPRPAAQWRWMPYATSMASRMPLPVKKYLLKTEQISEGTGSTLEALEKRELITMCYLSTGELYRRGIISDWQGFLEPDPIPTIQITSAGRKLVRQALGIRTSTHVAGTLKEWHWRALSLAYAAREGKGVLQESRYYGHIGWKTWLRLRDYPLSSLIQEYHEDHGQIPATGSSLRDNYVWITPFGIAFYERTFSRYHALYPTIEAPVPPAAPDPFEPYINATQDSRTCHACQGSYLVTVTRTYEQGKSWTWTVQEQDQHISGLVTSKYGKIVQCTCLDQDIQEIAAPLLTLLDRFTEQGWRVSFPHHFLYDYLDYLVGGMASGRENRWYEPALVREKLQPLLDNTDIDDERNIMKGEMHYYYNEQIGKGSVYLPSINGGESMHPVAIVWQQKQ